MLSFHTRRYAYYHPWNAVLLSSLSCIRITKKNLNLGAVNTTNDAVLSSSYYHSRCRDLSVANTTTVELSSSSSSSCICVNKKKFRGITKKFIVYKEEDLVLSTERRHIHTDGSNGISIRIHRISTKDSIQTNALSIEWYINTNSPYPYWRSDPNLNWLYPYRRHIT